MRLLLALALMVSTIALAEPWQRHCIDNTSQGADGVRLYDVDHDGLQDIVTGWEEGGVVRVYRNPGPEQAKQAWPLVTVGEAKNVEDAFAADLNNDGQPDVVSFCEGNTQTINIHWAPKSIGDYWDADSWRTEVLPASKYMQQWMFGFAADINRDGRVDIIAAGKNKNAAVGWFEAPENPHALDQWQWHPLWDLGWVMSMIPRHNDQGLFTGFILSNRREPWCGLIDFRISSIQNKQVNWTTSFYLLPERENLFMTLGVFLPGDPIQALVAAKGDDLIAFPLNGHTATSKTIPMPPDTGSGKGVAIDDIDLDGRNDIVFTCEHAEGLRGVMGYRQSGTKQNPQWQPFDIGGVAGTKFDRIELIDLDGDGDLDLLTCEEKENLGVIWYENPTR